MPGSPYFPWATTCDRRVPPDPAQVELDRLRLEVQHLREQLAPLKAMAARLEAERKAAEDRAYTDGMNGSRNCSDGFLADTLKRIQRGDHR